MHEQTLEIAVDLFWKQGVEQTSYADLVLASGLSRKALYRIWPDKSALVLDALRHYVKGLQSCMIEPFAKRGRAGLDAFGRAFVAGSETAEWNGCFLMRSASGPLREDSAIAQLYASYVSSLVTMVAENIRMAHENGEWADEPEPERTGRQFVSLAVMLSVFASQPNQQKAMDEIRNDIRDLLFSAG